MKENTIEQTIKDNGFYISTIVGDSMMPLLRERIDSVYIVPAGDVLNSLDIPLYKRPSGQYVLHRIMKVKKGYYLICGDNRTNMEKVPFEWVVGVATSMYREDKEIKFTNQEYINYSKKVTRNFWKRKIKRKLKSLMGKMQ